MPPDLLTRLFETLRLRGLLSFVAELRAEDAVILPSEGRIVRFHLLRQGSCTVEVPGEAPVRLERGDLALIPHGASQTLRGESAVRTDPVALPSLLAAGALEDGLLRGGSGPTAASLLCGYCQFDPALDHPILAALAPLIVLRGGDGGMHPGLEASLRLLSLEAERLDPGAGAILTRAVEIVLVQAVRAMIARARHGDDDHDADGRNGPGPGTRAGGFLAALADRRLGRALAAIHRAPAERWTLDALAREAGMSRAAFAERFAREVGEPPIAYLARWRLALARDLLGRRGLSMDEVAGRVGYSSVAAFSRRFKASYGIGPGAFRRRTRTGA